MSSSVIHLFTFNFINVPSLSLITSLALKSDLSAINIDNSAFFCLVLALYIGEGNGTPLRYSCLENPMDGRAWWAAVYGVAQSRTRLKRLSSSSSSSIVYLYPSLSFLSLSTVQLSGSAISDSLGPHGLQHSRLSCPSPTPGACSNSCPSSEWYHPTISDSVVPFSSCLQSFPASGSFPMSNYWSYSFSISPSMNVQDWFPLGWTGWISLPFKGFSRVFSNTTVQKHQFFGAQLSL